MKLVAVGAVAALAFVAAASSHASGRDEAARPPMMVGDPHEYPDLAAAGKANVRRARRVLVASRRNAPRFATPAKAARLGYEVKRMFRPGFVHARKNGSAFWGRVFDAAAPQSLLFWCPSKGGCTLAAFMYRAPAGRAPSTWGDLLMWHRHGTTPTAGWMTHVWLVRGVRNALATCAPWMVLERDLAIRLEPYKTAFHHQRPCTGKDAMPM